MDCLQTKPSLRVSVSCAGGLAADSSDHRGDFALVLAQQIIEARLRPCVKLAIQWIGALDGLRVCASQPALSGATLSFW